MNETKDKILDLQNRVTDAIKKVRVDEKESELEVLESQTNKADFWNDKNLAAEITQKVEILKKVVLLWRKMENDLAKLNELLSEGGKDFATEIDDKLSEIETELKTHETETYFGGEYDGNDAILSIYSGAGGVDAQDWSEMLLAMYLKFAEKHDFKTKIVSLSPGAEAGLKSVSVEIKGLNAYGYLKSEAGVHRLVRISPYDADKARHTSFSLVEIIPEIEKTDFELNEKELKIETYRASGHGGQSVNTTDSAVRITHTPTQTVVTCQNERSQLQNKETALKVLKSRLAVLREAERNKAIKIIRGENLSAEWGSQIRSYVLHPYQMVKDHRTNSETSNVQKVLEGDLDQFVEAYLKNPEF